MSRDDGLPRADTDTGMMSDPKVLALARLQRDPIRTLATIALYDAVRLASWKEGERLALPDCMPGWCLDPLDDLRADLVTVRLLDADERIPEHAWLAWFGPARERMNDAQRRRIFGGLVRMGWDRKAANIEADRRVSLKPKAQPKAAQPKGELPTIHPSIQPRMDEEEEENETALAPVRLVLADRPGASLKERVEAHGYVPGVKG
jgi:hypothetical protein